ncbi:MAG: ERAP1-like C-terminal domain-containing protein, partial [Candidatus Saccharimonas sp.]
RNETVLLNSDTTGHYVVNYDEQLRHRIISHLEDGRLSDIQRAQFLNEQMMLARGGHISSASLIELLALYVDESNEKVWDIMSLAISDLKKFVETDEKAEDKLRKFVGNLASRQFDRLGMTARENESEDDTKMRATIIACMAYSEDPRVIVALRELYGHNPLDELDPELRAIVIGSIVKYSDDDSLIEHLIAQYRTSSSSELKSDIASGLTATKRPEIVSKLLEHLKDAATIRKQDLIRWYVGLLSGRYGRALTWRWMRDEWPWIESAFDGDKSYDYFPRYSASLLTTREQLDEYAAFFTPLRDNPALTRTIDMGLLDLTGRIELLERDSPAVIAALYDL